MKRSDRYFLLPGSFLIPPSLLLAVISILAIVSSPLFLLLKYFLEISELDEFDSRVGVVYGNIFR